jgi:hypothetical protein
MCTLGETTECLKALTLSVRIIIYVELEHMISKAKINTCGCIKLKVFCTTKETRVSEETE